MDSAKNLFWVLLNITLVVAVLVGLSVAGFLRNQVSQARTITVSAEGRVAAASDIATITFSVVTDGNDPKAIQEENVRKINGAIAFVKGMGIEAKDIKTTQFSLLPRYSYPEPLRGANNPSIDGYTITQSVTVEVRDFEKIAPILAGLPGEGINQIYGPTFEVDDQEVYLNTAREEAFRKARAKVDAMARQNGVRVRRVVTFSEGSNGPIYYGRLEAAMADGKGGAMPPVPTIEPGEEEVTVQVSVTYEIR